MVAGTRLLIIIHGDNLLRPDLQLRYRLSPDLLQTLSPIQQLSPSALSEWRVAYLVERKARHADTLVNLISLCVSMIDRGSHRLRIAAGELGNSGAAWCHNGPGFLQC